MSKIREIINGLDDNALTALANKGLLRRGQKDLESGQSISITQEDDSAIVVTVSDFEITIPPEGPSFCRCTCPALDICRHIICALLFLKQDNSPVSIDAEEPAQTEPEPKTEAETEIIELEDYLTGLSLKDLQKWGGKKNLQLALTNVENSPIQFHWNNNNLSCFFTDNEVNVHFIQGLDLTGAIYDGESKLLKQFVLTAVLRFQQEKGKKWEIKEQEVVFEKQAATGTPRTREQVLETVMSLLLEMLIVGLSHLSETFSQRLETLAISSSGVELPKLSLMLRGLAEESSLILERDARANEETLLQNISLTFAVCSALKKNLNTPPRHLVGYSRTKYEAVNNLELTAVSAYQWETKSNFAGITLLFWDNQQHQWYSWSDSRPMFHDFGFNPQQRYLGDAPWSGGLSLEQISRSCVELIHPKTNYQNRLSSSAETTFEFKSPTHLKDIDFGPKGFSDWEELLKYRNSINTFGLKDGNPLDNIIAVKPFKWGRKGYDQINQEFFWLLEDKNQNMIVLTIPYNAINEKSINFLEHLTPDRSTTLICRLEFSSHAIKLYPFSVLNNQKLFNLSLDKTKKTFKSRFLEKLKNKWLKEDSRKSLIDSIPDESVVVNPGLVALSSQLQGIAESGTRKLIQHDIEQLTSLAENLQTQSLTPLAEYLKRIIKDGKNRARNLIQANYLCSLYIQALNRL